jgi:hypothetical protein
MCRARRRHFLVKGRRAAQYTKTDPNPILNRVRSTVQSVTTQVLDALQPGLDADPQPKQVLVRMIHQTAEDPLSRW